MLHIRMRQDHLIFLTFLILFNCSTKKGSNDKISLNDEAEYESTITKVSESEDTAELKVSWTEEEIQEMIKENAPSKNDVIGSNEDEYAPKSTSKTDTTKMNKAEKLMWLHDKTIQLEGEERATFEQLFLKEYPNSFEEYEKLYGYDMDSGAAPLYYNMNHVMLFASLEQVDKRAYYNKYLNISVNGIWDADNIQDFGVYRYMLNDPEIMLDVMDERSNKEIISIMRYVFDGPHPDNYQEKFDTLISVIKPYNSRIAKLTTKSYQQLLSEHDGHGH